MNAFIILAEDKDIQPSTLQVYHDKPELARRLAITNKAYHEAIEDLEVVKNEKRQLKKRYDKLYETASIFGGESTVGNYSQR